MATISLRQLAKRIGTTNQVVKGLVIGLGIKPLRTQSEFLFSEEQAQRVEKHYRKHEKDETPR